MTDCKHENKTCSIMDTIRCNDCGRELTKEELGMADAALSPYEMINKESMLDTMIHAFNKEPKLQEACKTLYKGLGELQEAIKENWPHIPWPNF